MDDDTAAGTRAVDEARIDEAREFIESKAGRKLDGELGDALRDGVALCELANALKPGAVVKVNRGRMPFLKMENIASFLEFAAANGVQSSELFQTVDLYEQRNVAAVVDCVLAVKRVFG
mmetsp:Transcript_44706/g.109719  ORF Transcript_44706/g.109719 Transcript_44706/m.109719 type:complete len:119 (-) Transcript_44706:77-433(-)